MNGRHGFSLVEMVIVLVLAGLVSTAAITMFSTQNRLNAQMTALGESQENARSAVQLAAAELRGVSAGAVTGARASQLTVRIPIVVGVICGDNPGNRTSVYFPMDGRELDFRDDADGKMLLNPNAGWLRRAVHPSDAFHGRASRQACLDAGNGLAGTDDDYATMFGRDPIGTVVMIYRDVTYSIEASQLDPAGRAFYRSAGDERVELAQGFSSDARFEYLLASDSVWLATVPNNRLAAVAAIRIVADVTGEGTSGSASGSAQFSLIREIQLRNAQ